MFGRLNANGRYGKVWSICAALIFFCHVAHAKTVTSDLDYLPKNQNYLADIPTPEQVLGYPVGTWHVRHDQLLTYMRALDAASDRITITTTGQTHEQRDLILMTITAANNHEKLADYQQAHLERIQTGKAAPSDAPLFIYMGYSVHGNEPSGANAALLIAYHLAASQSPEVLSLLAENVVLLDPALNPDGLSRFAQWANMHKGKNLVADPRHREHIEHWPSGRTNHYWFDLNRDWLLLTHPESQARIKQFHQWRPHVLTDFHEMGTNSTYFFQPGVSSRKNPWTPDTNVTLTKSLGNFHAQALDDTDQLYFTEESFDDFYYGKGSTYPDAHGSIGILFEQASSRGHLQESINGELSFPASIQNQVTTSLSTFKGSQENKAAILAYQSQFHRDTASLIKEDDIGGFVVSASKNKSAFERALSILISHKIKYEVLDKDFSYDGKTFKAEQSVYVPVNQVQYRLIRSLFSERQRFVDNTFYDVSNWNLPLAFNLPYESVSQRAARKISSTSQGFEHVVDNSNIAENAYAYVFEWHDAKAPSLLQSLLEKGFEVRLAGADFAATVDAQGTQKDFNAGAVMISRALAQPENWQATLKALADDHKIKVTTITSGLTSKGIDLGSRQFAKVELPNVLIVGGKGTSQYEVGEIWHYLDTRVNLPATLWDLEDLNRWDIDRYTHIIFANGRYGSLSKSTLEKIESWVQKGGVLIGQKNAITWFAKNSWIDNKILSNEDIDNAFSTQGLAYGDRQALRAKKLIAGSVYKAKIDLTHPLFFGYENEELAFFKTSNLVMKTSADPFENIAIYKEKPLVAGYTADELQALIGNTTALTVKQQGRGVVIAFVDNIHFRGYWDGTNKLMANSIFMSSLL